MKRVDFKKHSSVFYIGKGLVIASIVITASLGFLLGFFVGKQVQPVRETESTSIVPLHESAQNAQEDREKELSGEQSDTPQVSVPEKTTHSGKDQQSVDSPQSSHDSKMISPGKRSEQPVTPGARETAKKQETKSNHDSPVKKNTKSLQDTAKSRETTLTRKYTVQIGAFKNPDEAEALKTKMSKKGYKAFVTETKTKKQEILHKVTVGEYRTRKEAEVLSIKIKNSEGLRTFVTFVMQEGATRQQ